MLIIFGCGGHGRSVADVFMGNCIALRKNARFCFVDPNAEVGEKIFGQSVYRSLHFLQDDDYVILAIGDNRMRARVSGRHKELPYINLIARDASLGVGVRMGIGNFIAHRAYMGPESVLGNHSIVNTCAVVEHECIIGDFCHIAPGSVVSGRTKIGNHVFLGAGATVIDKISIADNIVVGAGAVVAKDLGEPGVYAGVPARKIR